ncbi:MAG: phosphatase PAP2 family protein [Pseudomonadota bacterium]|nr:phosphatase PAP2 family protein [Pseudomonadota bacterium]
MATRKKDAPAAVAQADAAITEALGEYRDTLPGRALSAIAKLGDQPELRLISGSVIAAGLLLRRQRLLRAGLRMLLAHEVATSAKDFVKNRIDRTRPGNAGGRWQSKPSPGRKTDKKHTSFPSGHGAGSVAVAQGFAREFPEYRVPALAAAGTVALGQIPKSAHYPTDVAAGSFIGAASEALLAKLWPVDSAEEGHPDPNETPGDSKSQLSNSTSADAVGSTSER